MAQLYEEFKQQIQDEMMRSLLIPSDKLIPWDDTKPLFSKEKVIEAYENSIKSKTNRNNCKAQLS